MTIFSRQVHRFSLMTYDYSNPNKPGPNSPVDWIRTSVEHLSKGLSKDIRAKLLVGLNFYGNDYLQGGGGGAILGHQYAELLAAHKPALTWNAQYEEHVFTYTTNRQKHTVYYPTVTVRASIFFFFFFFSFFPQLKLNAHALQSIQRRFDLAKELGVGISVWEIGQGLDYWYSMF